MSAIVDLLRDRARLALRGASEERVVAETWRRTARRYRDAFLGLEARVEASGVLGGTRLVGKGPESERTAYVLVDGYALLAIIEAAEGADFPAAAALRARLDEARGDAA